MKKFQRFDIDSLSDELLVKIFLYVDDECLKSVNLVCKRWNYLTKTPEFWYFKCHSLDQRLLKTNERNLNHIQSIIQEKCKDEDIDWKSAYFEMKCIIKRNISTKNTYLNQPNGKIIN